MTFRYQKLILGREGQKGRFVARPFVPVFLHSNGHKTPSPYFALLDSGADRVIFPADIAFHVGISVIEQGDLERATGIAGQTTDVYYHNLAIQLLGDSRRLPTAVGFCKDIVLPILGRPFFYHFRKVIFQEQKEQVDFKS